MTNAFYTKRSTRRSNDMKKALEQRKLGQLDKNVSFIGFGALSVGRDWGYGEDNSRPDAETAGEVLNHVLDMGINVVDTASAYHRSEERIGNSIADRRAEYVLSSKCGEHNDEPDTYYDFSYQAVKKSIDVSLDKLNTDFIDIMFIHFGPEAEKVIEDGETLRAMKDAQQEGKIGALGASIDGELATKLIESGDFDVMQMEYNLLNRTNERNIKLAAEKGISVYIRGGLAKGKLTSKGFNLPEEKKTKKLEELQTLANQDAQTLQALALQFLYEETGISTVLLGTKNVDHIKESMELLNRELPAGLLDKAKA